MPNYVFCFKKPFSNIKTVMASFAISVFATILFGLGLVLVNGFILETTRKQLHADHTLPEWNTKTIPAYFFDGLKVFFISFVYFLPALILFFFTIGGIAWQFFFYPNDTLLLSKAIFSSIPFFLICAVLFFFGWIFSIMGTINLAEKNRLKAAFDIIKITKKILTLNFAESLIVSIAFFFILFFILVFFSLVSLGLLAPLLIPFLLFYVYNSTTMAIMTQSFTETE